jgi:hypothetical protein
MGKNILTEEYLVNNGFTKGTCFEKRGCRYAFRNYGTTKAPRWGVFVDNFMDTNIEVNTVEQFNKLIKD